MTLLLSRLPSPAQLRPLTRVAWALLVTIICATGAHGQLRIVTYNTATADPEGGITTARADMDIVLQSIGEEPKSGIAKPIDVLLLQEQYTMATSTQSIVDILNGIYGTPQNPAPYARGVVNGQTSHPDAVAGRPGIVYNTQTVQLVQEIAFGIVNAANQPRSTMRYRLRPIGYDSNADFYVYNSHYKAGDTATDETRRQIEANSIRTHNTLGSNALGEGAHIIYAGDHNFYTSAEPAVQTLLSAGAGQAFDPVNRLGSWSNNASFADVHTQSPCLSSCIGAAGGMDDRFDFQFVTGEMLDGEGMSIINGSYRALGNNGTTYNTNINSASNTYSFRGAMTYTTSQILTALRNVTDHLPVVADYQLPAVMEALAGTVPATLAVGEAFDLDVMVWNAASVLAAVGADVLDYSLTTSGDLSGSFLNQVDAALGGVNTHLVALDTSTPGLKSGMIAISSTSQQVQNGLISIPVQFEVLAAMLAGDYNGDGTVDAADYVVWRQTLGESVPTGTGADGNANGMIDPGDYTVWTAHFGASAAMASGSMVSPPGGAVPEPGAWLLALWGVCLTPWRGGTLRAWTRKN